MPHHLIEKQNNSSYEIMFAIISGNWGISAIQKLVNVSQKFGKCVSWSGSDQVKSFGDGELVSWKQFNYNTTGFNERLFVISGAVLWQ